MSVVDLALLVFTVVDLRRGARPEAAHGLAAVYLGFSVVFGPSMVRWADVRVAHWWGGGPAPSPEPPSGTSARATREWREFAQACGAVALSVALLSGAILLVGDDGRAAPLIGWIGRLGQVLGIWFVGWPLWETARAVFAPRRDLDRMDERLG